MRKIRHRHALGGWIAVLLIPACGGSGGGGGGSLPATVVLASASVSAATGGTVEVTTAGSEAVGTKVDVPAGALAVDTTISITQINSGSPYPSNVLYFEFGPPGTLFSQPATVTVKYSASYLADHGIADPMSLQLLRREADGTIETLRTTAHDVANRTISAQTKHFTNFFALGYSNASLTGTYFIVDFLFSDDSPQGAMPATGTPLPAPRGFGATYGMITFDGGGNCSFEGFEKSDGLATPDADVGTYSVDANGRLTIHGDEVGAVLSDGSLLAFTSRVANSDTTIAVGIKKGGSFGVASLDGEYFVIDRFVRDNAAQPNAPAVGSPLPMPTGFGASFGTMSFDGAGAYLFTGSEKSDGTLTPGSRTGTYSVDSDGDVEIDGNDQEGVLLAGGDVLLLTNQDSPGDATCTIALRKQAGGTDARLSGSYFFMQYFVRNVAQSNAPGQGAELPRPKGFGCVQGVLSADGSGNYVFMGEQKLDQQISAANGSGTYAVSADGSLTIDGTDVGVVLEAGHVAVATHAGPGGDITLTVLVRTATLPGTQGWIKSADPVLDVGAGGQWDDAGLGSASVLKLGPTSYRMWYFGSDGAGGEAIGTAASSDGLSWTKDAGNPVFSPSASGWDSAFVSEPWVLFDGVTYRMWYSGGDGTGGGIGLATSTDGLTWTRAGAAPVLTKGGTGAFDALSISGPCVLFDGAGYRMWYDAYDGFDSSIGYATSTDGITWTKRSTPVLQTGAAGAFDDDEIEEPRVVFDGSVYRMWYAGVSSTGRGGIGYAVSSDGILWTKYAASPVIYPGPAAWDVEELEGPCVLIDEGVYRMWYQGNDGLLDAGRIGHAIRP